MSKFRFQLAGKEKGVEFRTLTRAAQSILSILGELDRAVAVERTSRTVWYVDRLDSNGRLTIDIFSRIRPLHKQQDYQPVDNSNKILASVVEGFENLELKGISPPYLSQAGLQRVQEMLNLIRENGATGFIASIPSQNKSITVGKAAADNLVRLLPEKRAEVSSIEGRLETITVHKQPMFIVYHSTSNKAVNCTFQDRPQFLELAKTALGRKVMVSGLVSFNEKNEPIGVKAQQLRVFKAREELPKAEDLTGSEPDLTGNLSTEDYLRIARGE